MTRFLQHVGLLTVFLLPGSYAYAIEGEVEYVDDSGQIKTLRGTIREETKKEIVVEPRTGGTSAKRIPIYKLDSIKYEKQPPQLGPVRSKKEQGRYKELIDGLMEIGRELPKDQSLLQIAITYEVLEAQALAAIANPEQIKDLETAVAKVGNRLDNTRHYYPMQEVLGRAYLEAGQYDKASKTLAALKDVDWPGYKEKATYYEALAALQQDKNTDALRLFDQVIDQANQKISSVLKQKAKIYKAQALANMGKGEDAEKLLRDLLNDLSPDETALKASVHNTLGDAMLKAKRNPKAVILDGYLWVPVVYNHQPDELARALYNLAILFPQIGKQEHAEQARARLQADFPNSPWTKKLAAKK